ncbi:hypothetical protein L249_5375 [Ophiocordyceps polyrhachis-furcata BCC 54312]|uniref:Uncharacterized protein n=1 Tax=Ophiocordyceps polyrhachis-furcata BCC 54312 TaxID=1330021 RepID=A0A367L964_9HYPO|nr:hypothetical protein L249_5375 [Ophiocordyceps polyrhachis-furcata BCC 54312]
MTIAAALMPLAFFKAATAAASASKATAASAF